MSIVRPHNAYLLIYIAFAVYDSAAAHLSNLVAGELITGTADLCALRTTSLILDQSKPGTHMHRLPSIIAIVPGLGSLEVDVDFDTVRDVGSADGTDSVFSSTAISVFGGSLSAITSTSGAGLPPERRISGIFSGQASVSAFTAVFTGSAGKSPISALRGHTAANIAAHAITAIPAIIYFFK